MKTEEKATKTVTIQIDSVFPATVREVWEKLQLLETLQHIAFPYATFKPLDGTGLTWVEGETSTFKLSLFALIPIGTHTIAVEKFDANAHEVYTRERNKTVPIWNHRIVLKTQGDFCAYTDEVEIGAGWKTPFVAAWSRLFYCHRQRRWRKLLQK